jgi:hypothetical protein
VEAKLTRLTHKIEIQLLVQRSRIRGAIPPPFLQYAFMAWCSVKAQGQLYLALQLLSQTSRPYFGFILPPPPLLARHTSEETQENVWRITGIPTRTSRVRQTHYSRARQLDKLTDCNKHSCSYNFQKCEFHMQSVDRVSNVKVEV